MASLGENVSDDELEDLVAEIDEDHSGTIEFGGACVFDYLIGSTSLEPTMPMS